MSLLEDVFLEDEAGEAQELERVIEGDEYEDRPRALSDSDDNSEKEDEAVEDKRRVDPTQGKTRVIKNPRFILNPARLAGPRGIQVIPEHFKDFKFKGKGHEKEDLNLVLKKLEHWAYRLYPKFQFEDCLRKIETLGKKRPVMVQLHKIRSDQFQSDEPVVQKDSSDEETPVAPEEDEFDKLLQQQIELARVTPAPGSTRKGFETPSVDKRSPITMPKATFSPSINEEQRERMMRNRQLAEERRLAKLKQNTAPTNTIPAVDITDVDRIEADKEMDINKLPLGRKHNRSNIIDSSDEEDDVPYNQAVTVNIHDTVDISEQDTRKNTSLNSDVPVIDLIATDKVIARADIRNTTDDNGIIDITDQEIHNNTTPDNEVTVIDLVSTDKPSCRGVMHNTIEENGIIENEIPTKVNLIGTDKAIARQTGHNTDVIDITEHVSSGKTSNDEVTVIDLIGTDIAPEMNNIENKNRSIINSSDDECTVTSVDQLQNIVDVHRTMDTDSCDVEICDVITENGHTNINDLNGVRNTDKFAEGSEIPNDRNKDTSNVGIEKIQSNDNRQVDVNTGDKNKESDVNSNEKVSFDAINSNDIEMIEITNKNDGNLHVDKMQVDNVQNTKEAKTDNIVEDLIDVDFSDDF